MAFFKVELDEEVIADYSGEGGGLWMNQSGMYDVILKAVIVDSTPNGSEFINLWVDHQGQEQPIFQAMRLTNNDGSPNLGAKLFTKLCVVIGATDGAEISAPVSRIIPMGKGGAEIECMVLEDFDNEPVTLRLQMEYGMYNGKIQERKNIRNFFRATDKATAAEIVNNVEHPGTQYKQELAYADKVTYKNGLTKEDILAWKDSFKKNGPSTKDNKPKAGFGKKRTFGKN